MTVQHLNYLIFAPYSDETGGGMRFCDHGHIPPSAYRFPLGQTRASMLDALNTALEYIEHMNVGVLDSRLFNESLVRVIEHWNIRSEDIDRLELHTCSTRTRYIRNVLRNLRR